MIKKYLLFTFLACISFNGCIQTNERFDKLAPGKWRGELFLDQNNAPIGDVNKIGNTKDIDNSSAFTEGVLPFNFEVAYDKNDSMTITFINGSQRIDVKEIAWGRRLSNARDTLMIKFVEFDTYIRADYENGLLTGAWYIPRKNTLIPFRGIVGKDYRFANMNTPPKMDLNGKWKAIFSPTEDPDTTVGEFHQKGNQLSGTFMSTTGDYGFLDGNVNGNRLYLSSFDGGHAYLFNGKMLPKNEIEGSFMSGKNYKTIWYATRDAKATLPDAERLTSVKDRESVSFSFPDAQGKMVSINDAPFKNKIKVVQVMGTWCPNCKDETNFLTAYREKHPNDDIAYLALAFEAYSDSTKVNQLLQNYARKMNVNYPILWAGQANAKEASERLPFLSKIMAFPTLFILDKDNRVVYVHTGFSGPATSEYNSFQTRFNDQVNKILNIKK